MLQDIVKSSIPFRKKAKVLIFGGGFSGQHLANVLRQLGVEVLCSRRDMEKSGADFIFNSSTKELPSKKILQNVTHVISCIPPSKNGEDPVLLYFSEELKQMSLEWVGYLSTTGVYGDSKGAWVNEQTIPSPKQQRSIRRLSCEKQWQSLGLPLQILRLPGIYGPGRSPLDVVKKETSKMVDKPGQVFSRIHIDDIACATIHLIHLYSKGIAPPIVNIADNLPATNVEVMTYAANLLKIPLPTIESFKNASKNMSPMALSFWKENRKISNTLLCNHLGYNLIHPTYKNGLKDCLKFLSLH